MTTSTENTFAAVELVKVPSKNIKCLEPRAKSLPLPEFFYNEEEVPSAILGRERDKKDYHKFHQILPTLQSSMSEQMPNLDLLKSTGNPYKEVKEGYEYDTRDAYKRYQPLPFHVFALVKSKSEPFTAEDLADQLAKKFQKLSKEKYYFLTVQNVLRDLCLFGLVERNSLKIRKGKTAFRMKAAPTESK